MKNKKLTLSLLVVFIAALVILPMVYHELTTRTSTSTDSDTALGTQSQSVQTAPDFTVTDQNGKTVSLSDFKGKPVVINFWASWCPPCKAELPDYETMYKEYSAKGVVFLMVNMTDGINETESHVKSFISQNGYTFPVYFDVHQSAVAAYDISSIPDSYFINANGQIIASYTGLIDANTMKSNLDKLIAE